MARRTKAITGLISEMKAQIELAKDPNILVFTPLGGLGPVEKQTIQPKMAIEEKELAH